VLILLYPEAGELRFPLIQRSSGLNHHANQIGLPGGALEAGESAIEAALRESREELGIDTETVEILRELSPLGLSVSAYTVYPVVGYTEKVRSFALTQQRWPAALPRPWQNCCGLRPSSI